MNHVASQFRTLSLVIAFGICFSSPCIFIGSLTSRGTLKGKAVFVGILNFKNYLYNYFYQLYNSAVEFSVLTGETVVRTAKFIIMCSLKCIIISFIKTYTVTSMA